MKYDYIVVGFGIAGMAITFQLKREGKKVLVIDGTQAKASHVAAGMYNPVILKRFSLAWRGGELLKSAKIFYNDLAVFLQQQTTLDVPVYRKFHDVEEQNNWFSAIDKPALSPYLSPYLKTTTSSAIKAPFKYGEVMQTGRVLVKEIFEKFKQILSEDNAFVCEDIDYNTVEVGLEEVEINGHKASKVIFCEGHNMSKNPFFNYLPLGTNRGAYYVFKSSSLKLEVAVKSHYFLLPLGNDIYKFGATYQNHIQIRDGADPNYEKAILKTQLEQLIDCDYEIIDFVTGVRPTVKDRRPLVGEHPEYKNLIVFNGLGTRGVTQAPDASRRLSNYLEHGDSLHEEIDINRFADMFYQT